MSKLLIVAHRGDTSCAPENTLAAFCAAIDAGAGAIELDVHLSRDGAVFVHHDLYLGRTCAGDAPVASLSSAQIRQLDAGGGERVPFLDDVLALGDGTLRFEIDLKDPSAVLAERVIAIVSEHRLRNRVEITSGHLPQLCRIRDRHPDVALGTWFNPFPDWMRRAERFAHIHAYAEAIGLSVVHLHERMIEPELVAAVQSAGRVAYGANLNTASAITAALAAGIERFSTSQLTLARGCVQGSTKSWRGR